MAKKFTDLRSRMSPASQDRAETKALNAKLTLNELIAKCDLTVPAPDICMEVQFGPDVGNECIDNYGLSSVMKNPAHPGEVLKEYLPERLSVTKAAAHLGISRSTFSRILKTHASMSAEMDLLLAGALGTTPGFWMRMQVQYDIWQAKQNIRRHVPRFPQTSVSAVA